MGFHAGAPARAARPRRAPACRLIAVAGGVARAASSGAASRASATTISVPARQPAGKGGEPGASAVPSQASSQARRRGGAGTRPADVVARRCGRGCRPAGCARPAGGSRRGGSRSGARRSLRWRQRGRWRGLRHRRAGPGKQRRPLPAPWAAQSASWRVRTGLSRRSDASVDGASAVSS